MINVFFQIDSRHSYFAIGLVIFFVTLMNTPNFLMYKIIEQRLNDTCDVTDQRFRDAIAYYPHISDLALKAHCLVSKYCYNTNTILIFLTEMYLTMYSICLSTDGASLKNLCMVHM